MVGIMNAGTVAEPGESSSPALRDIRESLEEMHRRLELMDRSVSDFLGAVARRISGPVMVIVRYADALQYGDMGELSARQLEKIRIINARARQIGETVDDLLCNGGSPGVSQLYGDVL